MESAFSPHARDIDVRLIVDSKLAVGLNVCGLTLQETGKPSRVYLRFSPHNSWDKLWSLCIFMILNPLNCNTRTYFALISFVCLRSSFHRRWILTGSPPARPTRLDSPQMTSSPGTGWCWRNGSTYSSPSSPSLSCEGGRGETCQDGATRRRARKLLGRIQGTAYTLHLCDAIWSYFFLWLLSWFVHV